MNTAYKLFLAILLTTAIGVASLVVAQRYVFESRFIQYARSAEQATLDVLAEELAAHYRRSGSWKTLAEDPGWLRNVRAWLRREAWQDRRRPGPPPVLNHRPREAAAHRSSPAGLPLPQRLSLLDSAGKHVAGVPLTAAAERQAIQIDGQTVGYVALVPLTALSDELDLRFSRELTGAVPWIAFVILICAALAAAWLARSISAPIGALIRGTDELAQGRFDTRINAVASGEFAALTGRFNELARALQSARDERRRWIADISHELRTPLTVLRAELESIEDGLKPLNADALQSFAAEVGRLQALIDDLQQLSFADTGTLNLNKGRVDLARFTADAVESFRDRLATREVTLQLQAEPPVFIDADPRRLRQLLTNLLENTARYSDAKARVSIRVHADGDKARLSIEDSGPGVPDSALPRLFERLYRVDPSRSRDTGAAGLGLSICEAIALAHDGHLHARHSELGGLAIDAVFPRSESS